MKNKPNLLEVAVTGKLLTRQEALDYFLDSKNWKREMTDKGFHWIWKGALFSPLEMANFILEKAPCKWWYNIKPGALHQKCENRCNHPEANNW